MAKLMIVEDKYYVVVPTRYYKLSKQEWDDFLKQNGGSVDHYRWQDELSEAIRRFRNSK